MLLRKPFLEMWRAIDGAADGVYNAECPEDMKVRGLVVVTSLFLTPILSLNGLHVLQDRRYHAVLRLCPFPVVSVKPHVRVMRYELFFGM